jgi:DNA topoisomerase-1
MRTDGVQLAHEAIGQTRRLIETKYGQSYVPASPRVYTSKARTRRRRTRRSARPTRRSRPIARPWRETSAGSTS